MNGKNEFSYLSNGTVNDRADSINILLLLCRLLIVQRPDPIP